jgi:hypothetical protein
MEPQSSLADRAAAIASLLAAMLAGLFGAAPEPPPGSDAKTVQVAKR